MFQSLLSWISLVDRTGRLARGRPLAEPTLDVWLQVAVGDPVGGGIDLLAQPLREVGVGGPLGINRRRGLVRLAGEVRFDQGREREDAGGGLAGLPECAAGDDEVARVGRGTGPGSTPRPGRGWPARRRAWPPLRRPCGWPERPLVHAYPASEPGRVDAALLAQVRHAPPRRPDGRSAGSDPRAAGDPPPDATSAGCGIVEAPTGNHNETRGCGDRHNPLSLQCRREDLNLHGHG